MKGGEGCAVECNRKCNQNMASFNTIPFISRYPLILFIPVQIRIINLILMESSIIQTVIFLKPHDPSQRVNGFLTLAGGIIITFTKEILTMITG